MKSIFDEHSSSSGNRGQKSLRIVATVGVLALLYAMGSTLAANISVGTGDTEFGQGIQVTTACDNQITVTPKANFNNSATPSPLPTPATDRGAFFLGSIEVSDIDNVACDGKWFTLKSFNSASSTPLELIDGALSFSVLNTSGTYSTTQSGFSVATNSATSFTINFTTPVAMSRDVTRVTLESSNAIPVQMVVTYSIGSVGPGGGTIFYVDTNGFNCGSSFSSTGSPTSGLCKYLEAAPVTWSGSSDPSKVWSTVGFTTTDISGISNDSSAYNNAAAIGLGYKNSTLIVGQGNTSASAAGSARAYTGGGKNDWYLPTTAELNLLCQWARGVTQNVTMACSGGTDNSDFATNPAYWSSSETAADQARVQYFNNSGAQDARAKGDGNKVRPIRAF
jgi:hypothetical protein